MIKVANCPCSLDDAQRIPYGCWSDDAVLRGIAAKVLGVTVRHVSSVQVLRRSVDARKKANVHYVLTLAATLKDAKVEQRLLNQGKAQAYAPYEPLEVRHVTQGALCSLLGNASAKADEGAARQTQEPSPSVSSREARDAIADADASDPASNHQQLASRPIVVGAGPAGLFAALYLARAGLKPLVVERGANVRERQRAVERFNRGGPLDLRTNIQFGEGGAGTFSDGKLTTGTKHPFAEHVLHWFVEAGAPHDILWDAKPHIGSDVLPAVVETLRNQILEAGGEVLFETRLADVGFDNGRLSWVTLESADGSIRKAPARIMLLACGHSARDTFAMLQQHGLAMEQKPFSVGVRIEHLQSDIDAAQYGAAAGHPALGAAEYKMAVHVSDRRSAYTFCMCPGGEVVCAASEEGGICTNGMSNRARDGRNANAALLVNVDPDDFGGEDPLAGVRLQREIEQRAFRAAQAAGGAPYQAPCQTVGDFLGIAPRGDAVGATCARGVIACDLREVLPPFVCQTMEAALPLFDRKLHGFASAEALMTAPETRSSSPVRIIRNDGFQAMLVVGDACDDAGCGIYPCGEGPGYAGGIMSAAADGMRVAARVVEDERERLSASAFERATAALRSGKAAVFPTDTVAGLGVSVLHAGMPDQIFRIKRRKPDKPVAWLVEGPDSLRVYGRDLPEGVEALARDCWPGPLTIIVKASDRVPTAFQSEAGTIGLRMPACVTALRLIETVGSPLATSSANIAGQPAADVPERVSAEVLQAAGAVLMDGTHPSGQASTVLDCSGEAPRILREGAVSAQTIASYFGESG